MPSSVVSNAWGNKVNIGNQKNASKSEYWQILEFLEKLIHGLIAEMQIRSDMKA